MHHYCMAPTIYLDTCVHVQPIRDRKTERPAAQDLDTPRDLHALPSLGLLVILRVDTRVPSWIAAVVPLKVDSQADRVLQKKVS